MIALSKEEIAILGAATKYHLQPAHKSSLVFGAIYLLGLPEEEMNPANASLRNAIDTLVIKGYLRPQDFQYELTMRGHEAFVLDRQELRKFHDRLQAIL